MGGWLFRHRMVVMAGAFLLALGLALLKEVWRTADLPWVPTVVGFIGTPWALKGVLLASGTLCLLAFALRTAAEARLREDVYRQGKSARLIQSGPFGWLRNPLYLGTWLFFTAAVMLWAPAVAWLLLSALFFLALDRMVRHEETLVAAQFPEAFAAYRGRVRRWIPLPRSQPGEPGPSAASWGWAAVGNLGLFTLGAFRIALACGAPARLIGLVNLLGIILWIAVIFSRRLGAIDNPRPLGK